MLVIDDDEMSSRILRDLLESAGLKVTVMSSPIGATRVALREEVDLFVLDLDMPAMNGDKLAALLREHSRLREVPTVLVSAASSERLNEVRRDLPGVDVVPKGRVRTDLLPLVTERLMRDVGSQARGPG